MGNPAVQNVNPFHTAVNGVHTALHFWNHTSGNNSIRHQGWNILGAYHMDEGPLIPRIPQKAPNVGEQNQLFRAQGFRQFGGRGVRVDIVCGVCVYSLSNSGNDRDVAGLNGVLHSCGIDGGNAADQSIFFVQLLCLEKLPVQAAQAHRPAAQAVELSNQVLVDFSAENGLDNVHSGGVGIAKAIHKAGLVANHFQHSGNFRSSAMDHHHPDAHQGQQHDIGHDGAAEGVGGHSAAAVFNDNGFAGVFLNVRQGFNQGLGLLFMGRQALPSSFIRDIGSRRPLNSPPCGEKIKLFLQRHDRAFSRSAAASAKTWPPLCSLRACFKTLKTLGFRHGLP